jgi:hypothetical protein
VTALAPRPYPTHAENGVILMRVHIRLALECSAKLTRENRLVEAVEIAEAAFRTVVDYDEHREIEEWLLAHANDFIRVRAGVDDDQGE